ncbi:MAG TPA: ankyrin repeat domain-containing protein, partial [Candidatus Paceibacterota bacterium]|nr:ankyrin repeat domain-containing protein [Candidatus Paceibacterota bacterium]
EPAADAVNVLLGAKADPNLVTTEGDHQGWGPLHYAADAGDVEIVRALLQHGAKPDALTQVYVHHGNPRNGNTPLGLAVIANQADAVKVLLQYKANPSLPDADGVRPLTMAINSRITPITRALLEAGADVNAPNKDGITPLQQATLSGDKSLVETVLAFHPDVNAQNAYGRTALDFVRNNKDPKYTEIAALLRTNGALENVPDFKSIRVDRQGLEQPITVHRADANGRNRFTLFETILLFYTREGPGRLSSLSFPALDRVIVHRPAGKAGDKERKIIVNLFNTTNGVDCAKDMTLEFGDVVEIPMREHALNAVSIDLSREETIGLANCLKRSVQLKVRGQSKTIELWPVSSYLKSVLGGSEAQSMLLSSSDLSRVKVTRRDPANGKQRWWLLDCTDNNGRFVPASPGIGGIGIPRPRTSVSNNQNNADDNDLWLRDGDVIEVPEK